MKLKIIGAIVLISAILSFAFGQLIVETNPKGYYQIKQAAMTGTMTAKMTPGMYLQMFGDITQWPKGETFFFTSQSDKSEGADSLPIKVTFIDGSDTNISGTMRVMLPTTEAEAIALTTDYSYASYRDLEQKLILPIVRKSMIITANMMTARESYAELRTEFISMVIDQIENGAYVTETYEKLITDLSDPSGAKKIKVKAKRAKTVNGKIVREKNPIEGLGIRFLQFDVKNFDYPDKVDKQISEQQGNLMAIATAKAEAEKAKQDRITAEEKGKAAVTLAQYEKEQEKIRAVVDAEKLKAVAELKAQQQLEVAKLEKEAAKFTKQRDILLGQGKAERKRLIMEADGALKQKLETYEKVMFKAFEEFGKQKWVPEIQFGNESESGNNPAMTLIDILGVNAAKDLALDMSMDRKKK
jgi:regulator of protease activity HflC (stomatin/prohibitin superfamily)